MTYIEGPHDQPWEAVEDEQDGDTYVMRRGYNERNNRNERVYWVSDAEDAKHLASELNRLDALAAWECQGCNARFAQIARPEMLKGVTLCSSCMKVKVLSAHLERTQTELAKFIDENKHAAIMVTQKNADLDVARARIALLTDRLDALCGAVEAERAAEWVDVRTATYLSYVSATDEATKAAREVLGG